MTSCACPVGGRDGELGREGGKEGMEGDSLPL
jgi:hypothetical protein